MKKRLCLEEWLCEVEHFLNCTVKKKRYKEKLDCKYDLAWKLGVISQSLRQKRR